jgi:hypothetical protein
MPQRHGFALAVLGTLMMASCARQPVAADHPPFEGRITESATVPPTQGSPTRIWVTVEPATHTGAAGLLIKTSTTIVVQKPDGTHRSGSIADLIEGARYRAWHTGIELRSLTPQYFATRIEVW